MTSDMYKATLAQAEADLAKAIEERDRWTQEIARLEHVTNSLSAMIKPDVRGSFARHAEQVGIQELVESCIRRSPKPLSAVEVRDEIKRIGYDLGKFQNPLAVVHGALKRLVKAKKIDYVGDGKYQRWLPFYGRY